MHARPPRARSTLAPAPATDPPPLPGGHSRTHRDDVRDRRDAAGARDPEARPRRTQLAVQARKARERPLAARGAPARRQQFCERAPCAARPLAQRGAAKEVALADPHEQGQQAPAAGAGARGSEQRGVVLDPQVRAEPVRSDPHVSCNQTAHVPPNTQTNTNGTFVGCHATRRRNYADATATRTCATHHMTTTPPPRPTVPAAASARDTVCSRGAATATGWGSRPARAPPSAGAGSGSGGGGTRRAGGGGGASDRPPSGSEKHPSASSPSAESPPVPPAGSSSGEEPPHPPPPPLVAEPGPL